MYETGAIAGQRRAGQTETRSNIRRSIPEETDPSVVYDIKGEATTRDIIEIPSVGDDRDGAQSAFTFTRRRNDLSDEGEDLSAHGE